MTIEVPRDRDGTFEPMTVRWHSRRMPGVDGLVTRASAKGLTTGEISAMLVRVCGAEVPRGDDQQDRAAWCWRQMADWQGRPLDSMYPVVHR